MRPSESGGGERLGALGLASATLCVLGPVLTLADAPRAATFAVVLAWASVAPGTAVLAVAGRRGAREPGVVVGVSLGVVTVAAQAMLWFDAWRPEAWLLVLSAACLAALAPRPRRWARGARPRRRRSRDGAFAPIWTTDVELSMPLEDLAAPRGPGVGPYRRARILVRLHGQPLGMLDAELTGGVLTATALVAIVRERLADELLSHLRGDGLPDGELTPAGLPVVHAPPCTTPGLVGSSEPFASVIVCSRDRPDGLRATLRTILALDYRDFEVVVVDNAPTTDATARVVAELGDDRLHYVLEPRPGLARAHNRGVCEAAGEIVAITDDDVLVDREWLRALARGFTRDPRVACVTGLVAAAELDTPAQQFFEAKVHWGSGFERRLWDLDGRRPSDRLYPYNAGVFGTGANFAISRKAIRVVGTFDEALGPGAPTEGGEDLDWFLRVLLAGHVLAYEPAALVRHIHRREDAALVGQMYGYGAGLTAYLFKHLVSLRTGPDMLAKAVAGLRHFATFSRSGRRSAPAPVGATGREVKGLLLGPVAYVRARRRDGYAPPPPTTSSDGFDRRQRSAVSRTTAFVLWLLPVAALALWAVSLPRIDVGRIAGLGLLDALPATYYAAGALLVIGFSLAVTRRQLSPLLLAFHVLALIALLDATTAIIYAEPRYAWTYKHIGATELIAAAGHTDRSIDAYNNWPGFFALNASLRDLSGLPTLAYAAWAQLFFNLANAAAVAFAVRGITTSVRTVWLAVWLFLLGNWIGQDYYSPQAMAFVLSLTVLGLALRCAPAGRRPGSALSLAVARRLPAPARRWRAEHPITEEPATPGPFTPRAALLVGGVCYVAVVVTHQLSPMMILASVIGLSLLGRRIPLWVPAAMAAIEAWWVVLALPFLVGRFDLLSFGRSTPQAERGVTAAALPGVWVSGLAARALMAGLLLLAVAGCARRLRAGYWDRSAAVLATAPVAVLALQSYQGEGALRAYLFALPWLAYFAAEALLPRSAPARRAGRVGWLRVAVPAAAVGALLLPALFGREMTNRFDTDDVRATTWLERHARAGSLPFVVAPNYPAEVTARYPIAYRDPRSGYDLTLDPALRGRALGVRDVPRIQAFMDNLAGDSPIDLIITPSQERFARLFGLLPPGSLARLERALTASGRFARIYRSGSASVYRYLGPSPRRGPAAAK